MAGKMRTVSRAENHNRYPENAQQMEMITASAMRCGFTGGMVVDFPNSTKVVLAHSSYHISCTHDTAFVRTPHPRLSNLTQPNQAKKYFLVLMTGRPTALPRAIGEDVLSVTSGTVGTPRNFPALFFPAPRSASCPIPSPAPFAGVGGRAREDRRQKAAKGGVSKRDWILHKKERARAQGREGVKADTKCATHFAHTCKFHAIRGNCDVWSRYTGRKRPRF
jgi:18S rRNA (guanine1575-N7)-methyltransferase